MQVKRFKLFVKVLIKQLKETIKRKKASVTAKTTQAAHALTGYKYEKFAKLIRPTITAINEMVAVPSL